MRVLWFSLTPSRYKAAKGLGYNGGGWIASLETELAKQQGVKLGVAFVKGRKYLRESIDDVTYYVMPVPQKSFKAKVNYFTNYKVQTEVADYLLIFKKVVDDFKPDVIQVFGSESCLGFVQMVTDVPCILHIQGILNPYWNAFFPPGLSRINYIAKNLSPLRMLKAYKELKTWENSCKREHELLKLIKHYTGRTDWDKIITDVFNSHARYHYCSEILRDAFYQAPQRVLPPKMTIVSVMSGVMYKGLDLILKTAYVMKCLRHVDFEWIVYGSISNVSFFERQTGIEGVNVNVDFRGVVTEKEICQALCNATAFAQTSYIDNSPNAVCEAQIVGCPVVSTNVGGIASLIDNGKTGILVPANDPYQMAWHLIELYMNKKLNKEISSYSKEIAATRHDKKRIAKDLVGIYEKVITGICK